MSRRQQRIENTREEWSSVENAQQLSNKLSNRKERRRLRRFLRKEWPDALKNMPWLRDATMETLSDSNLFNWLNRRQQDKLQHLGKVFIAQPASSSEMLWTSWVDMQDEDDTWWDVEAQQDIDIQERFTNPEQVLFEMSRDSAVTIHEIPEHQLTTENMHHTISKTLQDLLQNMQNLSMFRHDKRDMETSILRLWALIDQEDDIRTQSEMLHDGLTTMIQNPRFMYPAWSQDTVWWWLRANNRIPNSLSRRQRRERQKILIETHQTRTHKQQEIFQQDIPAEVGAFSQSDLSSRLLHTHNRVSTYETQVQEIVAQQEQRLSEILTSLSENEDMQTLEEYMKDIQNTIPGTWQFHREHIHTNSISSVDAHRLESITHELDAVQDRIKTIYQENIYGPPSRRHQDMRGEYIAELRMFQKAERMLSMQLHMVTNILWPTFVDVTSRLIDTQDKLLDLYARTRQNEAMRDQINNFLSSNQGTDITKNLRISVIYQDLLTEHADLQHQIQEATEQVKSLLPELHTRLMASAQLMVNIMQLKSELHDEWWYYS